MFCKGVFRVDKQYAIFDMDGTLVDSMPYWQGLCAEYLESRGVRDIPPDLLERIAPMTILESSALFLREFGLDGTPEQTAAEINALMERHYRADVPLKPGVPEYLEALHARGVRMCVASATTEPLVRACLERLGAAGYFQFMLSCEAVGAGKNRPDVYLEAARRLGGTPGETAVYEDAIFAARTAKGAGFYLMGVYDACEQADWPELSALADETVEDYRKAAGNVTGNACGPTSRGV